MCDISPFADPEELAKCRCRNAVMTCYRSMLESGAADSEAANAAFRVYRFHHPEDPLLDARLTVERWIYARQLH